MRDPTKLSRRDITGFLHNAQLAAVEDVDDKRIPAVYEYHKHLYQLLTTETQFTPTELIAVLTSTAYALHTGGVNGKTPTKR
jgi:allophanate hydrolase subunit 1